MSKDEGLFEVYLRGGQTFRVKAVSIDLKWDSQGNVTSYNFTWKKPKEPMLGMPPQSIIGVRRIR